MGLVAMQGDADSMDNVSYSQIFGKQDPSGIKI